MKIWKTSDVALLKKMMSDGASQKDSAISLGCSVAAISNIKRRFGVKKTTLTQRVLSVLTCEPKMALNVSHESGVEANLTRKLLWQLVRRGRASKSGRGEKATYAVATEQQIVEAKR